VLPEKSRASASSIQLQKIPSSWYSLQSAFCISLTAGMATASDLRSVAGFALALGVIFAGFNNSPRPTAECSQATQGVFWPLEANRDPMLLQKKAAAGDLWLCRGDYDWDAYFVQTIHFFKWERVTVHVNQVKRNNNDAVKASLH